MLYEIFLKKSCDYIIFIDADDELDCRMLVILLGLIFIILRKTTYGEMLMSAGFCMEILTWRTSCTGIAGYQYISQYATG